MLWFVEFRKHLPVFATVYVLTAAASVAAIVQPDMVVFDVIRAMCGLLCWTATIMYSASVIARFVTLGGDLLLQISGASRWRSAWRKAAVLGILLTVQHLVTTGLQITTFTDAAGSEGTQVLIYLLVAKIVSITAFLTLTMLLATVAKFAGGRGVSITAFGILLFGVVLTQTLLLWRVGAANTRDFFIGVGGDAFTVNLYANILPITLTGPGAGMLPPVTLVSLSLNFAAAMIFVLVWAALARTVRWNFLPA